LDCVLSVRTMLEKLIVKNYKLLQLQKLEMPTMIFHDAHLQIASNT